MTTKNLIVLERRETKRMVLDVLTGLKGIVPLIIGFSSPHISTRLTIWGYFTPSQPTFWIKRKRNKTLWKKKKRELNDEVFYGTFFPSFFSLYDVVWYYLNTVLRIYRIHILRYSVVNLVMTFFEQTLRSHINWIF